MQERAPSETSQPTCRDTLRLCIHCPDVSAFPQRRQPDMQSSTTETRDILCRCPAIAARRSKNIDHMSCSSQNYEHLGKTSTEHAAQFPLPDYQSHHRFTRKRNSTKPQRLQKDIDDERGNGTERTQACDPLRTCRTAKHGSAERTKGLRVTLPALF